MSVMSDDWGLDDRDREELVRRLGQVVARLRLRDERPSEPELAAWSGWICLWMRDRDAYRRVARRRVLALLRMVATDGCQASVPPDAASGTKTERSAIGQRGLCA